MRWDIRKFWIEKGVYPLMEMKKGNRVRTYLRQLQQSQRWDPEKIDALQKERLTRLLMICANSVPAYRDLAFSPTEIQRDPFQILAQVQPLSKKQIQQDPEAYQNRDFPTKQLIPNQTGGSTGEPLRFYMTRVSVEHSEAARWRGLSWWGITPGSSSLMVWGNPIELQQSQQKKIYWRDAVLKNRKILSAYALHETHRGEYLHLFEHWQPEYLYGYATALFQLAEILLPEKEKLHINKLKVVVSTAETLSDKQKQTIRQVFGCPVINEYGARDAGILAYECPAGHLHLSQENCIVEILDPLTYAPLPAGKSGVVAVTELTNEAMPRLRYLLGDTASLSPERCPCGLTLPVLKSLDGREDAMFSLPNGTLIHGNFINQLSRKYPSIRQFQLIQTDLHHAELKVVQETLLNGELQRFAADVAAWLPGIQLQVHPCAGIEREKSGKFRYAIRRF